MKEVRSDGDLEKAGTGEPVDLGRFNGHEIYPMPMFVTIAAADVAAVSDWYVKALGFVTVFLGPLKFGQPTMVHLRRDKYQDVLIIHTSSPRTLTTNFQADDLDVLALRAREAESSQGSTIDGPVETPWNTRELRVTDPTGNRLVFTSRNANADPKQAERIKKMFDAAKKSGG